MFDRIKKAFFGDDDRVPQARDAPNSLLAHGPVSEWASTHGIAFSVDQSGEGFALKGKVGGKPWWLQLSPPTRNYIFGEEVRARADLDVKETAAVLIMNRPLRDALEKQASKIFTDPLQPSADLKLPEEMRWLAMLDEVGWDSLPPEFWDRYSVLTDRKADAVTWIDSSVARLLLDWPTPAPSDEVPFMMLLMRGKAHLRMEYTPAGLETLQHVSLIFRTACEGALARLRAEPQP